MVVHAVVRSLDGRIEVEVQMEAGDTNVESFFSTVGSVRAWLTESDRAAGFTITQEKAEAVATKSAE